MLNLSIILFIQFLFCLFFFLYFRKKIYETLKLNDFRKEVDEVIIAFNRQAERHINYLENLLDNELIKKSQQNFIHQKTNDEQNKVTIPDQPDSKDITGLKTSNLSKNDRLIQLPPKPVKTYYSQFNEKVSKKEELTENSPQKKRTKDSYPSPREQLIKNILALEQKGSTVVAISKRLAISTAEVKLILKLNKSKINTEENT